MKIFITGGAGFIGSAVVRLAISEGHSVVNIDALTYAACLENLTTVSSYPEYDFEHIDIRNRFALDQAFEKYEPDAVIHLAAESHVDRSIHDPFQFIDTNILGTFNVLEAARHYWSKNGSSENFRFLHVSTDEVFGSLECDSTHVFKENTPYDPHSPYSASKASSDHLVRAWHSTYGLPVLVTNCSNNYGPHQFPEKLIPVIILNALDGQPLPIYGDGSNVRDWLFVEDHAKALLKTLKYGQVGRSYNIGGGNEQTNLNLVTLLCNILDRCRPSAKGRHSDLISFVKDRPGHDERYAIDCSRIRNELDWQPSVTLEEGLVRTVKWYIANEKWWRSISQRGKQGALVNNKT